MRHVAVPHMPYASSSKSPTYCAAFYTPELQILIHSYMYVHVPLLLLLPLLYDLFYACNEIASHIAYTIRCRRRQQFSQAYANIQMYVDTMWHAHQGWLVGPFLDRSILFFFRLAWKYFKLSGNLFHFDCLVESLYNLHLNENTF